MMAYSSAQYDEEGGEGPAEELASPADTMSPGLSTSDIRVGQAPESMQPVAASRHPAHEYEGWWEQRSDTASHSVGALRMHPQTGDALTPQGSSTSSTVSTAAATSTPSAQFVSSAQTSSRAQVAAHRQAVPTAVTEAEAHSAPRRAGPPPAHTHGERVVSGPTHAPAPRSTPDTHCSQSAAPVAPTAPNFAFEASRLLRNTTAAAATASATERWGPDAEDELAELLMAWYNAGYQTGYYKGLRVGRAEAQA